MKRTGFAELRLCEGYVPMYKEMVKLAAPTLEILIQEYGTQGVLKRFSDPVWFQCYACAMGFEHNYTGATTVTLKAIKESLQDKNVGIFVVGGKGENSRKTPEEIDRISEIFGFNESKTLKLVYTSRITAKVDNTLVQDSFSIYFHSMIIDEKGNYTVINQGMNTEEMLVRRYHWFDSKNFIEEPHASIAGSSRDIALDLTNKKSRETRKTIEDIIKDEKPEELQKKLLLLDRSRGQSKLVDFLPLKNVIRMPYYLSFPKSLNLEALRLSREAQNFEEILGTKGMGPSTMRGLAYIASLIYGSELSWKDPQRYCYAYGTKAGKPWYVERESMRASAEILKNAIEEAKLGKKEKLHALKRMGKILERVKED